MPPLKTPWHALCNYPGIINAHSIMNGIYTLTPRQSAIMRVALNARCSLALAETVLEAEGWDIAAAIQSIRNIRRSN